MGTIVTFDYPTWANRFPEFSYVSADLAINYFNEATIVHRNDGGGPVESAQEQLQLLNLLTAHIAFLYAPNAQGQPASPLVGRISSASEGTVNVATTFDAPKAAQWYVQTRYGAQYWGMTAKYRAMRYRAPPRRRFDPIWPIGYWDR